MKEMPYIGSEVRNVITFMWEKTGICRLKLGILSFLLLK